MLRSDFLRLLALAPFAGAAMPLDTLRRLLDSPDTPAPLPALFVGHGNPMHAIQESDFTRGWRAMGSSLPRPTAVLCISAHWETVGTRVTAMERPRTIHDFGGFPRALYDVDYPASGDPALARDVATMVRSASVEQDHAWGLDHGAWTVLRHMFPQADVPVVQLSLDSRLTARRHYELARELRTLRRKGVLIVGSGNIVHNLRLADWNNPGGADWAIAADARLRALIETGDHAALIDYPALGSDVQRAVPTPEHFLPLLYVLAQQDKDELVSFFNDRLELGALSMTSVRIS
jgi:4,5-DOPA dioxygenase extradiol